MGVRRSRGLRLTAMPVKAATPVTRRARVLGLDPGSLVTGYGVIDLDGSSAAYVASGSLRTGGGAMTSRLTTIFEGLGRLLQDYQPDEVAIERVFMKSNPDSALKLGHARGAALCAVATRGIEVHEYAPREVKLAVVGTGAADKRQVQHMVKALVRVEGRIGLDASDALAIALCHAHHRVLGGSRRLA